jgi:hypothetical protein
MPVTIDGSAGITTPAADVQGNLAYTGTLTGGTGVVDIGAGQLYKAADGKIGIGTASPTTNLDVNGQISGKFTDVGTDTLAQNLAVNHVSQVTIANTVTLTTTVPPAGTAAYVIIITSGVTSRTVTFGTGFRSAGTLATGTVAARRFVFNFISDGTSLVESSRTAAIA